MIIVPIILLTVAYLYGYIVYRLFNTSENNYIKGFKRVTVGLFVASFTAVVFYAPYYMPYFQNFSYTPLFAIGGFYILLFLIYFFIQKNAWSKKEYYEKKKLYFAVFDYRYILSMSSNIIFQELGILITILLLKSIGFSILTIVVIFSIIAVLVHTYLIFMQRSPRF